MMGWGGVVAQGLLGAAEGAGAAGAQSMLEQEKEQALARRDAALASLAQQTHAANTDYNAKSALENAGPMAKAKSDAAAATADQDAATNYTHTLSSETAKVDADRRKNIKLTQGQSEYDSEGKLIVAAPNEKREFNADEKALNDERRELVRAQTAKLKEQTAHIGEGKPGKEDKPKWKSGPTKDEDGNPLPPTILDENSPLMQEWVKSEPATPGSSKSTLGPLSWGKDVDAKPETKGHWVTKNRFTREEANIEDVYKGYSDRADKASAGVVDSGTSSRAAGARTEVARRTNAKTGQVQIKYSDGTVETR